MITPIMINLTPRGMHFKLSPDGSIPGSIYTLLPFIERYTDRRWDKRLRRKVLVKRYLFYDTRKQMIYFPRCDLDQLCSYLTSCQIPWKLNHLPVNTGKSTVIPFKHSLYQDRTEIQRLGIESIMKSTDEVRALALQTGTGKTYSAIKAASLLAIRPMFCVGGLIEQWLEEFYKFTYLEEKDIYVIQGGDSIKKLLDECDKTIHPKVILSSIDTLRGYATNNALYSAFPDFDNIFNRLNVGVKLIDEAHLNFHTNLIIDIRTNVAITIPLSATFDRTDEIGKALFTRVYPATHRFGEDTYNKYVDIYIYEYSTGVYVNQKTFTGSYGYNHSKYEDWLLKKGAHKFSYLYDNCISNIFESHYMAVKKPGERCMILCFTKDMCQKYVDVMSALYPDLTVAKFIGESSKSVLKESDVIITTPGSGGTGTDIKNLKTVICVYNTNSDVLNEQMLGRLRQLDDPSIPVDQSNRPIFVGTYNRDIAKHVEYQRNRAYLYKKLGYTYTEYKFP